MLGNKSHSDTTASSMTLPISFRLALETRLQLSTYHNDFEPDAIWRYYSYHVGRHPHDLRAHVQRLLTGINAKLTDKVAGALQDLFLSVGENGFALREKMLTQAKTTLNETDVSFFETWLKSGRPKDLQWRDGSILTDSFSNQAKLVVIEQEDTAVNFSIMDEVQSYLEYGQIDAAQKLLETELSKTPSDIQLAQELLNIYLYTRDKDNLQKMTDVLKTANVALSEDWLHVQQEAMSW